MFSKLVMTILVALVGLSVVAASPVNAAAPSCPPSNNQPHDPLEDIIPTRPLCCTGTYPTLVTGEQWLYLTDN